MLLNDGSCAENPARMVLGYGVMILATIALFFAIRSYGETLVAPATVSIEGLPAGAAPPAVSHALFHLLLALAAVIILGRILAKLFA
ncbi:MAG: hypothetical protein HY288_15120 [Planctomycetia bacterium]|nr:hypothetical protein [Planctomycetia bacterium]